MTKRLLILILLSLTVITTACGTQGNPQPGTETAGKENTPAVESSTEPEETGVPLYPDYLPEKNYDGYKYLIASYEDKIVKTAYAEELNGDVINDALVERNHMVEEKYNVSIEVRQLDSVGGTSDPMAAALTNFVAAGDCPFDLFSGHDATLFRTAQTGIFLNLREIPEMDFTQPWNMPVLNETYTINNRQYIFSSYLSYNALGWAQCFLINKGIANDNGIKVPYDLVFDGKWTLDKLIELGTGVAKDLNGDGAMNREDQFGLISSGSMWGFQGAYIVPYARESDGRITLKFDQELLVDLSMKMLNFKRSGDAFYYTTDPVIKDFAESRTLFHYGKIQDLSSEELRDSGVEFGVLPIPKWDEDQANYVSSSSDRQLVILTTAPEVQRTAVIAEALASTGYSVLRPAYFEVAMTKKFTPDPESTEILYLISDTLAGDLAFLNGSGGNCLGRVVIYTLKNDDDAISSRIASQLPVEQANVDKMNDFYFGK